MKKYLKTYEMKGFNEVQTSTTYCGIRVSMSFKNGNVVMGKNARLQTDNRFAQDAIESDYRFQCGNIKLVSSVEIPDADSAQEQEQESKQPKKSVKKVQKDGLEVVDSVKTLNDLDEWFADKGVTLEGSGKSYIAGLCEKYGVSFPNLKL